MSSRERSHRKGKGKGKGRADDTSAWSNWEWDEGGWWYKNRTGPSGQLEYQYEYPSASQTTPRSDGAQPTTTIRAYTSPHYTSQANEATQTLPVAPINATETASYHGINEIARQPLASNFGYTSSNGSSFLSAITNQFASTHLSSNASSHSDSLQNKSPNAMSQHDPYEAINDGSRFFKVGRVFRCMWAEPAGSNARGFLYSTPSSRGEEIYSKDRHFVVVQEQRGCCSCLTINTYGRQGTKKRGVIPDDHAVVYDSRFGKSPLPPGEKMTKEALPIIVETVGESIDPMSRINFARVYTVEHNVKVLKVGRIKPDHISRLRKYWKSSFLGDMDPPAEPSVSTPSTDAYSYSASPPNLVENTPYGHHAESIATIPFSHSSPGRDPSMVYLQPLSAQTSYQTPPSAPTTGHSVAPYVSTNYYYSTSYVPQDSADAYSAGPGYTESYNAEPNAINFSAQSTFVDQAPSRQFEGPTDARTTTSVRRNSTRWYDGTDSDRNSRR